jgi:hypothetical protein
MERVRDRFWLWGHIAGSHNEGWNLPESSRITPAEAAYYLGIPNVIMVTYDGKPEPPFDQEALALSPMRKVCWSIVGDSSSKRNDEKSDLDEVVDLASIFPNITGAIMDDFFDSGGEHGIGRYGVDELQGFNDALHGAVRPLDLWVVLYTHQLEMQFEKHLDKCDVLTFWTWNSDDLSKLEENFAEVERRSPGIRKVLGCYMWDYGPHRHMPVEAMQMQCELGLKWLKEGRIEGMIFLSNCVADIGLPAVEWSKKWIAEVGDEPLG